MIQVKLIAAVALCVLLIAGCKKNADSNAASNKVRVGYIGITCEAPIYIAFEKGFFKEEGLEPELVKCEWSKYKDVLALGGYDITHHLVMYFLKPIEQGLDVKFTAGIHSGCLRVQAGVKGNIHKIEDLQGKEDRSAGHGHAAVHFRQSRARRRTALMPEKKSRGEFFRPVSSGWRWKKAKSMRWPTRSRSAAC